MRMPYTEALLKSIPKLEQPQPHPPRGHRGRPPDLINPPHGLPVRARGARTRRTGAARRSRRCIEAETPGHTFALLVPGRVARGAERRSNATGPPRAGIGRGTGDAGRSEHGDRRAGGTPPPAEA